MSPETSFTLLLSVSLILFALSFILYGLIILLTVKKAIEQSQPSPSLYDTDNTLEDEIEDLTNAPTTKHQAIKPNAYETVNTYRLQTYPRYMDGWAKVDILGPYPKQS
jgi:predicted PurR-regulated permease PerM